MDIIICGSSQSKCNRISPAHRSLANSHPARNSTAMLLSRPGRGSGLSLLRKKAHSSIRNAPEHVVRAHVQTRRHPGTRAVGTEGQMRSIVNTYSAGIPLCQVRVFDLLKRRRLTERTRREAESTEPRRRVKPRGRDRSYQASPVTPSRTANRKNKSRATLAKSMTNCRSESRQDSSSGLRYIESMLTEHMQDSLELRLAREGEQGRDAADCYQGYDQDQDSNHNSTLCGTTPHATSRLEPDRTGRTKTLCLRPHRGCSHGKRASSPGYNQSELRLASGEKKQFPAEMSQNQKADSARYCGG